MGEVISGSFGSKARQQKNKRSSLCKNGHHRWKVVKSSQFDVKQGKLVTVQECTKCGKTKATAE